MKGDVDPLVAAHVLNNERNRHRKLLEKVHEELVSLMDTGVHQHGRLLINQVRDEIIRLGGVEPEPPKPIRGYWES